MRPLATAADLATYLPGDGSVEVPTGAAADRLILRASELVGEAATSGWLLNGDGDPALTWQAEALRDATLAQIEQWLEVGEENDIAGYPRTTAMSSSGLSMSALPSVLAPRARRILRSAGLTHAAAV